MKDYAIRFHRHLIKSIVAILAFSTLTACSYTPATLKNSYNNLGKDYVRELKQMGDLTPEQEAGLDKFAVNLMQWHRQNILPEYANFVAELAEKLESPQSLSDENYHAYINFISSFPNFHDYHKDNLQFAKLAASLSDEQFIQVRERVQEETRDTTEFFQNTSWEKRKRRGIQSIAEGLGFFNIELTNTQLDIARKYSEYHTDAKSSYINSNEKWNNELIDLLSKRHESNFVKHFAQHMQFDNLQKRLLKTEAEAVRQRNQITANMYKELVANLSKQQKTTLIKQLKSVSKTMRELVNENRE